MESKTEVARVGVGARAPDFASQDMNGNDVTLSRLIGGRKAVLIFYRGGWCPFCNQQLASIASDYERFLRAGAVVVAVSSEGLEEGRELHRRLHPPFPLLSDPAFRGIDAYGVRDENPSAGARARGVNSLSKPAAFVIDGRGTVVFKHVGANPRDRPTNDVLLRALEASA